MKGCFMPREFPRTLLPTVFQRVSELSEPEKYNVVLLFEHIPLSKANSVPDHATAYRRNLTANALAIVYAQEQSEEVFKYSRDACHEICGFITGKAVGNIGYGNYSECPGTPACFCRKEGILSIYKLRESRQRRTAC